MTAVVQHQQYKDSHADWIGHIPLDWEVAPLFAVLYERDVKNKGNSVPDVLSLSYGRIVPRDVESNFGLLPESFETYQIVMPGNIILRLTDLQNDQRSLRCGLVEQKGIITSAYTALESSCSIDSKYAFYLLFGYDLLKVFYGLGSGVRQSMTYKDLKRMPILVPPMTTQKAIVSFLDRKTAEIDALIADKQRMIELLQERRQALITEAVTKALDTNAPMKDSGVEWIGEIPEEWEVLPLKYCVNHIGSGKTPSGGAEIYSSEGVVFLRSQNIHFDGLRLDDVVYISDEIHNSMLCSEVHPKDVLLNITGASLGRVTITPESLPKANVNQHVCILRTINQVILPDYLALYLQSNVAQLQIFMNQNGISREALNYEQIGRLLIIKPNATEQEKKFRLAKKKTTEIDEMIVQVNRSIDSLRNYRQSLITEAVTGKINVSELQ